MIIAILGYAVAICICPLVLWQYSVADPWDRIWIALDKEPGTKRGGPFEFMCLHVVNEICGKAGVVLLITSSANRAGNLIIMRMEDKFPNLLRVVDGLVAQKIAKAVYEVGEDVPMAKPPRWASDVLALNSGKPRHRIGIETVGQEYTLRIGFSYTQFRRRGRIMRFRDVAFERLSIVSANTEVRFEWPITIQSRDPFDYRIAE